MSSFTFVLVFLPILSTTAVAIPLPDGPSCELMRADLIRQNAVSYANSSNGQRMPLAWCVSAARKMAF